jgi:hypothetical protein
MRAKAIRGLSIGYREIDVIPADKGEPRKLVKLALEEVSLVSFPANRRALVDAVKADQKLAQFARALRDGEPLPIKDFEDILRDAGVPKSMATAIASRGYAQVIRSESDDAGVKSALAEASDAIARLTAATR